MSRRYSQQELRALLTRSLEQEIERKRLQTEQVIEILKAGNIPTPEPIVHILAWSGVEQHRMMRHHTFWKEAKIRAGFDALIGSALAAHLDLAKCNAALTAYADSRDPFAEHVNHTVENPAQKEVMAFCAAYVGTVDTLRRLKSTRPELAIAIDELRQAATGSPEFRFILDLRKNLSHGSVTVPGWSTSSDFKTTTGVMKFNAEGLLAFGTWSPISRTFIGSAADGKISIAAVTAVCARGLAQFRRNLRTLLFKNRTASEIDYYNILDLSRKIHSRQFLKIILQGHVEKGTDPYPYLPQFFSLEVVREILRRPPHSVEQVEYIISQRAADTDCDDALRAVLYKLFTVQADIPDGQEPPRLDPPPLGDKWP
jgi:hypothetical protein